MKTTLLALLVASVWLPSFAERDAGLILHGIDTISTNYQTKYFDFFTMAPCSTWGFPTDPCNGNVGLQWESAGYVLYTTGSGGLSMDMGKMNLDSIKFAPPDSLMHSNLGYGLYRVFHIDSDSLKKCVGNCYIIKTGVDPRQGVPFRAKLKILNFMVVDTVLHDIKMRFLWACNISGQPDLTTSGLDTFHLDTVPTLARIPSQNHISKIANGQYIFKVMGDRFTIPQELAGKGKSLAVFDLQGRKLFTEEIGSELSVDLHRTPGGGGVRVVRITGPEIE